MWGDAAQRRILLRVRQPIANCKDSEVSIDGRTENREPKYYVRQLMADSVPGSPGELKNQWGWGGFTTHDLHRCSG